jgi:murein DD-endopeptidase MepM/ murein hydrolase activator NlpD
MLGVRGRVGVALCGVVTSAALLAACGAPPAADNPTSVAENAPSSVLPTPETSAVAPTEPSAGPSATPSASAVSKASSAPPKGAKKYVFPVQSSNVSYHPTHGKYPATDLFANCGSPLVAVTDGEILEISREDKYVKGSPDGPDNGGLSVSLLGDDGVRYYGSHYRVIGGDLKVGDRVTAGQVLGELGRTGNANNVCHLHFGISPPCARTGDWKVRRGVIWPKEYLDSWRKNGTANPVEKAAAWAKEHDCKA